MRIDCHNHTTFSPDATQTIDEIAAEAKRLGIGYLALTEHLDLGFPNDKRPEGEPSFDYLVTEKYFDEIEAAKKKYGLRIVAGIEAGYTEDTVEETAKELKRLPFEYVINSVHICHGLDCYWDGYFDGLTKKEAYAEYIAAVRKSLEVPYRYDAVGHFGYIARPAPYEHKIMTFKEFPDEIDDVLAAVIKKGKILEVNTSVGISGGLCIPDVGILERYYALGGRLINIGSDSHSISRFNRNYAEVSEKIKSVGFREWAVVINGKIETEAID